MFTYDLSTNVGKVRMLVPDTKAAAYVFEDAEYTAMLTLESNDVRCAAALALETIASDVTMTLKVITINGLSTNGPATATALMARAAKLREQAAAVAELGSAGFDIAEMVLDQFSWLDKVQNEALT
jgi:hypothetical protein